MAKKKLLNEAQVRRFMGLAGLKPVSRAVISEMAAQYEQDEDPAGDEADVEDVEAAGGEIEDPMGAEPAAMDAPAEGGADVDPSQIEAAVQGLQSFEALLQPLADAAGIDMASGAAMDPGMEAPPVGDEEMPPVDDEEELPLGDEDEAEGADAELSPDEEADLEEVNLQLSEDEVVQEVARRVARRIIKAKKAQALYNEAMGNKRPKRTVKSRMSRKKRRK
jgi:hypothetical protein